MAFQRSHAHSPTHPARPTPTATTSATMLPSPDLPTANPAAPLPCELVAVPPDRLAVDAPLGWMSVVVEAAEDSGPPGLMAPVDEDADVVAVIMVAPVADGPEVSEVGSVKPLETVPLRMVRGCETTASWAAAREARVVRRTATAFIVEGSSCLVDGSDMTGLSRLLMGGQGYLGE